MKKLYAKTSFSSKNRKVSSKNDNDLSPSNSSNGSSDIIKYHDPILAYQPSKSKDFINESNKYKPKHPFGAKIQNLEQLRNSQFSLIENSNGISPQNYDESPYYYTITELENLHMLDHRHPHFHQHHRMQQQQQQMHHQLHATSPNGSLSSSSAPHTKVYHQHNQLVLQLPIVSSTTSTSTPTNSSTSSLAPDAVDSSMSPNNSMRSPPIYEAPQRMNSIASSILSRSSSNLSSSSPSSQRISTTSPPPHQFYGIAFNDYEYHYDQQQHPQMSYPNQVHQHSAPVRQQQLSSSSGSITSPRDNLSSNADFMTNSISPTLFAEQSIIGARASVMVYDDNQKKWVPSGTSSGLSKVQIYHHQQNNTFRVVGRKLQDHEVVINCSILKGLKYNQATATFHQWRDSKYVYGLNFSSPNDAEAFARAMMHALEVLSGRVANNPGQPTNGNGYEEDMGYRTMTSEDAAILRQQQQITGQVTPSAQTPTSQTNQNNIPQSPPTPQQGHHRTSRNSLSAPPAPQPPHMQQQQQQQQQQQHSIYGHTTGGGPTQNGMQQHPQPPMQQQQQQQIPPGPGQPQQQQYHAPTQMQQPPPQQQQQHGLYATQQMVNAGAYQQQQNQQPIGGMIPQAPQPPMPPPHQNGGGPSHYVSSQQQMGPGIPNSQSANGIYGSQPQMGGGVPMPPQPPQPPAMPNGPPAPPNAYGQMNGGGQVQQTENPYGQAPGAPPMMPVNSNAPVGNVPMPPPLNRMSNTSGGPGGAPVPGAPAPPPPPAFGGAPPMYNGNVGGGAPVPPPPQPPAPPAPPAMGGPAAPPPPPPPPIGGGGGGSAAKKDDPQADLMGSLAAQLQQAKLKKKSTPAATENSGSSTPSGGSGNYGTIGRGGGGSGGGGGGMASMMDEMAKTLARRRAQAEKKEPEPEPEVKQRPWEKSNTLPHKLGSSSSANSSNSNANSHNTSNSGSESPRPIRKRFGSASEETILKVNGDGLSMAALSGSDLEQLKAEIVREMKTEIQKVKQEIIDAIKSEFNRR